MNGNLDYDGLTKRVLIRKIKQAFGNKEKQAFANQLDSFLTKLA